MAMHPERLSYLAGINAPARAVVRCEEINGGASGSVLTLECGHSSMVVSHFDASFIKEKRCRACGFDFVKSSSLYAEEFA